MTTDTFKILQKEWFSFMNQNTIAVALPSVGNAIQIS